LVACSAGFCGAVDGQTARGPEPTYLTILGQPEEFASVYRPSPPSSTRQIGFAIILYTLKTPVEEMRRQVAQALDKAERTGYPLLVHLDDWNYPAPSTDPDTVEWTAFPKPGDRRGPPVRRRWINWGTWFTTEAPPNYESRRFRSDLRLRVLAALQPLAARWRQWRKQGRGYLLAGVVSGWESGFYTMPDFRPGERPRAGAEAMADDEIVRTGYAALTARGVTADLVRRKARRERKAEAQVMDELMHRAVHDYTAYVASLCRAAGVPRDRVYTHFTGLGAVPRESVPPPLRDDGRNIPLWAAVNGASRPGITATVPWTDVDRAAKQFRALGRSEWGAVEVEFTDSTRTEEGALRYITSLSDSGARVICVYGWWEPPGHMFGVRGSGAVAAMKTWLRGGQ
jgi:hypothetical protein